MTRDKIYKTFFLATFVFFGVSALTTILPFIVPILWAIVIGIVLYPVHNFLKKRLRSDTLSALITTFIVLIFMIVPLSILSVLLIQQAVDATQKLIYYLQTHSYKEILESIKNLPVIREQKERLGFLLDFVQREEFRQFLADTLNRVLKFLGDKIGELAFLAGKNVFYIFVFLITFFFILKDGPKILGRIEGVIPLENEVLEDILKTIYRTILAVVYGSVGTALVQAIIAFVGFTIVGIKFSLLWSVATFFAAFIPPFGASAVWFPLAIYSFINLGLWQGIFLFLWGSLLISTVDNIIRPLIIKQGIQIPYIILFFSTIGGLIKFGFIGLFLGPIIFTTLLTLFKIYEKEFTQKGI